MFQTCVCWIFCPGQPEPQLFDSHSKTYGDKNPDGATLISFKDMKQLMCFLSERFPLVGRDSQLGLFIQSLPCRFRNYAPNNQSVFFYPDTTQLLLTQCLLVLIGSRPELSRARCIRLAYFRPKNSSRSQEMC